MGNPNQAGRVGSVLWSSLIVIGVLALGVSVMLPSTKRARIQFNHPDPDAAAATTTSSSTQPATAPTTPTTAP